MDACIEIDLCRFAQTARTFATPWKPYTNLPMSTQIYCTSIMMQKCIHMPPGTFLDILGDHFNRA